MNASNAKDYLPLVQALAEGRVIQMFSGGKWISLPGESEVFIDPCITYRIKPEPREIFVIRYKGGSESGPFSDKEAAECFALHDHEYSIVCYREVLE